MKRKGIEDFFIKSNKRRVAAERSFGLVPGLRVIEDFVTPDEELTLLNFLVKQQWRTDLARRVIHYGGNYCLMPPSNATPEERARIEATIIKADDIPAELDFVLDRMIDHGLYSAATKPAFCIVNEYKDNQGISAHVENFRFASPVCGLTLGDGDSMRFHELVKPDDGSVRTGKASKAERTGQRQDVWMPARSLLVMSSDSRERWQHEIVRSKRGRNISNWKRTSLTFRTERTT